MLTSLEPATGVLVGLFMLGERLTAAQALAIRPIVAAPAGKVVCGRFRGTRTEQHIGSNWPGFLQS
ncbi:hypothetical protein MPL1032_160167 [Mesorhizobium plurifarium]|uniref:Uncharacterized protein n=1 Tax=Mesorhizobium plurifarium TaxID=69974 RepID=A0A0K2VSX4_MESPL|nr:hypothetical protein MPL1032_160167 [Mesorhizobium plurifarium]